MSYKEQVKVTFDHVKVVKVCIVPDNLEEYKDAFLKVHNFCREDEEVVLVKNQYGTNNIFIYFVFDVPVAKFTEANESDWRKFVERCEEWSSQFAPVKSVRELDDCYYSFDDDLLIIDGSVFNY